MAVAVNCCVVPLAIDGLVGVTWTAVTTAGVTVSVVEPLTPLSVAEIVVEPTLLPVARPLLPAVLLMLATVALEEAQVALVVTFCVVLLENTAVAVNCCVVPLAMEGLVGVTSTRCRVVGVALMGSSSLSLLLQPVRFASDKSKIVDHRPKPFKRACDSIFYPLKKPAAGSAALLQRGA